MVVTCYSSRPTDEFIADKLVGCTLAEVERALVLNTLAYLDGNRTQAAMALGISVRCLRDKIRRLRTQGVAVPSPTLDQRSQADQIRPSASLDRTTRSDVADAAGAV